MINVEITAVPLKDEDGNIVGGLEYIVDVTNRVKMEKDLRVQTQTILEYCPYLGIVHTWLCHDAHDFNKRKMYDRKKMEAA